MIAPPERSPERDDALEATLLRVPDTGWTIETLRRTLRETGGHPDDATLLFPGGATDMVEAVLDLADRRMAEAMADADLTGMRLPQKLREAIRLRLAWAAPHKEASRRALAVLSVPRNARMAAATLARTVDEIWRLAGDRSADFSWYTKRAILAGIYTSTLLFWLRDHSLDDEATLAFLDRRLAGVGRMGAMRRRVEAALDRWTPRRPETI